MSDPIQLSLPEFIPVLHKPNLGRHSLFILADGSIDLSANDEQSSLTESEMSLNSDETYRLFISLYEQFKSSSVSSVGSLASCSYHKASE